MHDKSHRIILEVNYYQGDFGAVQCKAKEFLSQAAGTTTLGREAPREQGTLLERETYSTLGVGKWEQHGKDTEKGKTKHFYGKVCERGQEWIWKVQVE